MMSQRPIGSAPTRITSTSSTPTENIDGWNFEIVKDLTRLFHKDLEETIDHEKSEKSSLMTRNVERTFSRQISTSILSAVDEFSREICVEEEDEKSEDAEEKKRRREEEASSAVCQYAYVIL